MSTFVEAASVLAMCFPLATARGGRGGMSRVRIGGGGEIYQFTQEVEITKVKPIMFVNMCLIGMLGSVEPSRATTYSVVAFLTAAVLVCMVYARWRARRHSHELEDIRTLGPPMIRCGLCRSHVPHIEWDFHRRRCAVRSADQLRALPPPLPVACKHCGHVLKLWPDLGQTISDKIWASETSYFFPKF